MCCGGAHDSNISLLPSSTLHAYIHKIGFNVSSSLRSRPLYYFTSSTKLTQSLSSEFLDAFHNVWKLSVLLWLRLHVAYTRKRLHLIGLADSAIRASCQEVESIEHVPRHCNHYEQQMAAVKTRLRLPRAQELTGTALLGPWTCPLSAEAATKSLLNFLLETGLVKVFWWLHFSLRYTCALGIFLSFIHTYFFFKAFICSLWFFV